MNEGAVTCSARAFAAMMNIFSVTRALQSQTPIDEPSQSENK